MVAIPASPRLPKLLSATTIALTFALLYTLFQGSESRRPNPTGAAFSPVVAQKSADSTVGWRVREPTPARIIFERQLDALALSLDSLASTIAASPPKSAKSRVSMPAERRAFRHARLAYMHSEALLQLYSPSIAHALNGPLENDDADAPARPLGSPAGFQIVLTSMAELTTDASGDVDAELAQATVISMRDQLRHLRTQTRYLDIAPLPVLESMRTEIARITTLGLAGFDLDDSRNAVREAAAAFDGMREVAEMEAKSSPAVDAPKGIGMPRLDSRAALGTGISRDEWLRIARALGAAQRYLDSHPYFNGLDRLALITRYANPASRAIADARAPLLAHSYAQRRVWRASAATVFDLHALDATAFAPDFAPAATPDLIALGARLFSDSRLSGAEDRSCATCHAATRAFSDGRARPLLLSAGNASAAQGAARNTPTLLNVAYQPLYFADERALSLEDQIGFVLASHTEMGSSATLAATHLARDAHMRAQFARSLAATRDTTLSARNVRVVLAAYLRSLDSFDSRFDRAVRGDSLALSALERRGFNVFMGKARCGTCHFAPLFSGVMPPEFTSSEPEIIGVATRPALHGAQLDPDSGRAGIDHLPEHLHAFKVPTLRNVAVTAPYMHNGAYRTLDEVLDFYEHGGGAGLGAHLANPTLPTNRLHLTTAERSELIAFMRSLTDTSSYRTKLPANIMAAH